MWKSLGWFALGFLTARYLILKNGSEAYKLKEGELLSQGTVIKNNIADQFNAQ